MVSRGAPGRGLGHGLSLRGEQRGCQLSEEKVWVCAGGACDQGGGQAGIKWDASTGGEGGEKIWGRERAGGLYMRARAAAARPCGGQLRNVAHGHREQWRGGSREERRGESGVSVVIAGWRGGAEDAAGGRRALWRGRTLQPPDNYGALGAAGTFLGVAQSTTGKLGTMARGGATGDSGAALGNTVGEASPGGLAGDSGACRLEPNLDWMPNCRAQEEAVRGVQGEGSLDKR